MGEPSAILAINSLDRYIATQVPTYGFFFATWYQGVFFITWDPTQGGNTPAVGGAISGGGLVAKIVSVVGNFVNIDRATTNTQVPAFRLSQTTFSKNNVTAPTAASLYGQYNDVQPYSTNFTIQSPGALIYGYINKIIVSQIQLQYNIPTVNKDKNDTFTIYSSVAGDYFKVTIPFGFYYADELASILQSLIRAEDPAFSDMTVSFDTRDGFKFQSQNIFYFPSPEELQKTLPDVYTADLINNIYKTYRLLGMTIFNATAHAGTIQVSFDYPNFLYTPYIDIYSDVLTNYQDVKDTNTSIPKPKGLVARVYVSGVGNIQTTGSTSALGTAPFVMTSDLNTPKVIRWEPNVAVPSLDFQLLDQYGEFLPGSNEGYSTEFQMTLLCVEGRD